MDQTTRRPAQELAAMQAAYDVFDLWDNAKSLGVKKGSVVATVPGTTAAFYKLTPSS
jgi:hypothetical protein